MYTVQQKASVDYAWDAPAARDKKIVLAVGGSRREVDIMEIGDLVPFKFAVSVHSTYCHPATQLICTLHVGGAREPCRLSRRQG